MSRELAPAAAARGAVEARFLPLDAFRGLIMLLLVSDGFGLRALLHHPVFHGIAYQFDHVEWEGAVFYDLIAPAFLFMVGMVFLFPAPDGPFTRTGNIGAVWDRALMGYNYASWTTNLNMVSTTVSALFGVWAANLLRSGLPRARQMTILGLAMLAGLAGGLALYLLIEVVGWRRLAFPLTVAGSNAIFLYSFEILQRKWLTRAVGVFTGDFRFLGAFGPVAQSFAVLFVMWCLCHWLYRHRIFLKL